MTVSNDTTLSPDVLNSLATLRQQMFGGSINKASRLVAKPQTPLEKSVQAPVDVACEVESNS